MSHKNPTPQEWLDHIRDGLEYRRLFGLEDRWGELEAIYYNVHRSMLNDGPNMFLSQGDAMLAQVTSPSPRIGVKPQTPGSVVRAPVLQSLDNTLMEELKIPEAVDTANLHAYLFGRGVLKCGFDSEYGYDPTQDVGGDLRLGMTLTQLNRQGTRRLEFDSTINPGMPWVRAVLPQDITIPWGVMDLHNTPWIAHRLVRHIDDLKADTKYSNTRNLKPNISMRDFTNSYRTAMSVRLGHRTEGPEWVEFYEIMDRRSGRIYAVVPDQDKYIRNDVNALQINNRLPYTSIAFTPRTRAFWTTPDAFYLLHIQNELSDTAVQRAKQRRLSVLKLIVDEGVVNEANMQKLASPEVGAILEIEGGRDLDKVLKIFQVTPNLFLAQEEELLRANAREQIGFSRNQAGEFSQGRKSASEVVAVSRSSQLRMSRRGNSVRGLYVDTIKVINGIIFKHWNFPRFVEVVGEEGAAKWQQFRGRDLAGKFSYKIDLVDEEVERQLKIEALQLYAAFSQDPSVNPVELIQWLTGQVNDPAFSRIFDADVRREMQQVPQNRGSPPRNGQATSPQQLLQGGGR